MSSRMRQICDPRFDGQFCWCTDHWCVLSPDCPVRVPKKESVQLYKSAAAAAEEGFRPCLRCRLESSPGTPAWIGSSWKISSAQLIDQCFLDDHSLGELAEQLAAGPQQLSVYARTISLRLLRRWLRPGAPAKKLIDETRLTRSSASQQVSAACVGSIRCSVRPTTARRASSGKRRERNQPINEGTIELSYRPRLTGKPCWVS